MPQITASGTTAQALSKQLAQKGLSYLLGASQNGFQEAKHTMHFPREQGFSAAQAEQCGDVFQRALIADVLLDAQAAGLDTLQPILNHEIDYLLSCQRSTGIGGWSYFPNLPELPPDADDLAQVMQVLIRSQRWTDLQRFCERPLSILLQDGRTSDGGLETWIVPTAERTIEQQLQGVWIEQAWGKGADPEVVANLLYALSLYNPKRFADIIHEGIQYLEAQQQGDGSWNSTWYHGQYYGTYVCLRLLAIACPDSPAIARAVRFLFAAQSADGGWGLSNTSDPLTSAIALLGLVMSRSNLVNLGDPLILKALQYLQQQANDQSWESCPFIQMQLGRASGQVRQVLSYGSHTITTTFVLKAMLLLLQQLDAIPHLYNAVEMPKP